MYFTADTHFYHRKIIEYCNRPYNSLEDMHDKLISNWNETVKPKDEIFILGDFVFGGVGKIKEITSKLNGIKYLVRGNHDATKPNRAQDYGFQWVRQEYFFHISLQDELFFKVSHYPYNDDHTNEVRYLDRRPVDVGSWLCHGHIHNAWKVKDRQINVGVDVWDYKPVHISSIVQIIKEGLK